MSKLRPVLTLAFSAAMLGGCAAVGPDYAPATAQAPEDWTSWRSAPPAWRDLPQGSAHGVPQTSWAPFQDPVLDALQARARQASPDVQTAALRFAQSRVQRATVAAQRGPQVNASGAASRQRQSEYSPATRLVDAVAPGNRDDLVSILSEPFPLYQAGFDASWELDLWGRVRRSVESADANVAQAAATLEQMRVTIASEVSRNYFEWRAAQAQLAVVQQDSATVTEALTLAQARRDGGLTDDFDATAQRAQRADLQSRIPTLQARMTQLSNQLGLLTGARPGELNVLLDQPATTAVLPDLALGLPAEVARRRPDIRAAEARLHAATANIGVAIADLYPRVTLGASFGLESTAGGRFGEWSTRNWQIGPSLSLPLFDQGRRRAVITLRRLEQQEAAVAFQQSVLQAWQEIDDALTAYRAEQVRNAALRDKLNQDSDTLTLAQARYDRGLTDYLAPLQMQRQLLQTRRERVESDHRLFVALVAIYKALGVAGEPPPA